MGNTQCKAGLFHMLDLDGDGLVSMDEFVIALQHLHGNARSIDMVRLRQDAKRMAKQLNELRDSVRVLNGDMRNGHRSAAGHHQTSPSKQSFIPPVQEHVNPPDAAWAKHR